MIRGINTSNISNSIPPIEKVEVFKIQGNRHWWRDLVINLINRMLGKGMNIDVIA
jgi:hypothetical protein